MLEVNPFEAEDIELVLVQGRLAGKEVVEIAVTVLDAAVIGKLQKAPGELGLIVPLGSGSLPPG